MLNCKYPFWVAFQSSLWFVLNIIVYIQKAEKEKPLMTHAQRQYYIWNCDSEIQSMVILVSHAKSWSIVGAKTSICTIEIRNLCCWYSSSCIIEWDVRSQFSYNAMTEKLASTSSDYSVCLMYLGPQNRCIYYQTLWINRHKSPWENLLLTVFCGWRSSQIVLNATTVEHLYLKSERH